MQTFEAQKSNALLILSAFYGIPLTVLLIVAVILTLLFGELPSAHLYPIIVLIALLCLPVSYFISWLKRRRIYEYQILGDKIVIKGPDTEIPFEQISNVEIAEGRKSQFPVLNGVKYYRNNGNEYCSHPTLEDEVGAFYIRDAVFVYTMSKIKLPFRGELNICFELTPKDAEGFVKALKAELERYRVRR